MKIVVFFATGYEEIEALAVVDVLRRGRVEVVMAGIESMSVTSARNITMQMDALAENIDYEQVDMLVLPGGLGGVEGLARSQFVTDTIHEFVAKDKYIGAICAAPSVLGKLGVLKGHRVTCYPGFEKCLEGADHTDERVVISGKFITGIGAGASLEFALTLLEIVKNKETAEAIKKGMLI